MTSPDDTRASGRDDAGLTRFCPACFGRNPWKAGECVTCGASLEAGDDFDERLVWALRHPDTATAVRAAQALGARKTLAAIPALREVSRSGDVYRAAAAAGALRAFQGVASADAGIREAREHPSVIVRRAVGQERGSDDDVAP